MSGASIGGLTYVVFACGIGTLVWLASAHTWDPRNGGLRGHVPRAVFLTVVSGALWPGTLVIYAMWKTTSGRRWLSRFLGFAEPPDDY